MTRACLLLGLMISAAAVALAPASPEAQQAKTPTTVKAGKGEKVCRVKLQYTGEVRTWVCRKEQPCCVWHEINYVKCGSTITGCL
jgi:predicted peptidase